MLRANLRAARCLGSLAAAVLIIPTLVWAAPAPAANPAAPSVTVVPSPQRAGLPGVATANASRPLSRPLPRAAAGADGPLPMVAWADGVLHVQPLPPAWVARSKEAARVAAARSPQVAPPAGGPANDAFAAAQALAVPASSVSDSTIGATLEPGEPMPCMTETGTVWYQLQAPSSGVLKLTANATFPVVVAVYAGTTLATLNQLACNTQGSTAQALAEVTAGQTYFVQVGAYLGQSGTFQLSSTMGNPFASILHGRVLDAGAPVAGLTPSVLCMSASLTCGWQLGGPTRADGSYTLFGDVGGYEVWMANFGSGVNSPAPVVAFPVAGGFNVAPDLAVLPATATLSGTVSTTGGAAVDGVFVGLAIPDALNPGAALAVTSTASDSHGQYTLQAAPGTAYDVQAWPTDEHFFEQSRVSVPGSLNVGLVPYARTIAGHVVDATSGAPVSHVRPQAQCVDDAGFACAYTLSGTGAYTLAGDPGRYDLWVSPTSTLPAIGSTAVTYVDARRPGTFSGTDLPVQPATATVQGSVPAHAAAAHVQPNSIMDPSYVALLIPSRAEPGSMVQVSFSRINADTTYSVQAVPGSYGLTAVVPGFRPPTASTSTTDPPSISLAAGTINHDFLLNRFPVSITGHILNFGIPVSGVQPDILLQGTNCLASATRSDATGSYTVAGDACTYELWVGGHQVVGNAISNPAVTSTPTTGTTVVDATHATTLSGQDIQVHETNWPIAGTVRGGGVPLGGAVVSLMVPSKLAPTGLLPIASVLTLASGDTGQYLLAADMDTAYTLTAEATGYRSLSANGVGAPGGHDFDLPAGSQDVTLLQQPQRLVDTRLLGSMPAAGSTQCFTLAGQGGIPLDAVGVVLNVTSVGASDAGWLTLYPAGQTLPATSTLNFDTHAYAIANGAIVRLGTGGQVCVNVGRSASHVVLDATGYLPSSSQQVTLLDSPQRVVDTRLLGPRPDAGATPCFTLAGQGGVPGDAAGVLLNVTSVGATDHGWLTLYPAGQPLPPTSTLNFDTNAYAIANNAIIKLGAGGQVCVNVGRAGSHIVLDVAGYLPSPVGQPQVQLLQQPVRVQDTRLVGSIPAAGSTPCFDLSGGTSTVPDNATGVIVNLTSTGASDYGWLTLFPRSLTQVQLVPATSTLNFDPRAYAIANGAIVRIGAGEGCVNVGRSASHIIIDVTGYLAP